ncbi:MAG: 30S ribosomal protein S15 [Fimbriimonadaceae bacterium]|jgi:small subunit ribosomal protein S15|nr:30S ribosomal protein S15 [Fimbriimonadaceae bacterium]
MPLDKAYKAEVMKEYGLSEGDTGSTAVQIAIMQKRIEQITDHLRKNKKDFHSRVGLLKLVGKRRRLEGYLRSTDIAAYRALISKLGIREVKPK